MHPVSLGEGTHYHCLIPLGQELAVAEEWERYGNPEWELTTVRHITHVPAARRVIEDGKIESWLGLR